MKRYIIIILLTLSASSLWAQMYHGMGGMLHIPSAEMSTPQSLRIGGGYLSRNFVPDYGGYCMDVPAFYIALTPYEWIDASFMTTAWHEDGIFYPDRSISLKARPLKEGKWWPAVVLGGQDMFKTGAYTNYYIAATKHFDIIGGEWGVNIAYRYYRTYTALPREKWHGPVGGITFRPNFYRDLRACVEYDGCEFNIGLDVCLFRFLYLQVILQDWKNISGGICFEIRKL